MVTVMTMRPGSVVKSVAGRDAGRFLLVLRLDGEFAYVADGKVRKLARPKKKRRKHLQSTQTVLELSECTTDRQIKRMLSDF